MQVKSYNNGTILKITNMGGSFYYHVSSGQKLSASSSLLQNLVRDVLSVGCAKICDVGCPPYSLLSNDGQCLLSNDGNYLLSNSAG